MQISVVVPVFNSAPTLTQLVERVGSVLSQCSHTFEIILVNDGSHDSSALEIEQLCDGVAHTRGIDLMRNYGQHNALLAGIREARNDVIITMDDDLQNPPEEIPLLLEKLAEGADVVYGTPMVKRHGYWRSFASRITKLVLQGAMGAETARNVSSFRAFRSHICAAFRHYESPYVNLDVLLTWGAREFSAVPVRHESRAIGDSNYTWKTLLVHALNMMTGFSTFPLRVASLVGFGFTLFGGGVLAYVLGRFFMEGGSVPGFPFLASIIAIFSGAQLFVLGIIGEYIARVHFGSMSRPAYVVRTEWGEAAIESPEDLPEVETETS